MSFSHRTICREVFREIGDRVASGLDGGGAPRKAGGGGRVNSGGVVHEVGREGGAIAYLFIGEVPGELVDNGSNHFHMAQFFGPYQGVKMEQLETADLRG